MRNERPPLALWEEEPITASARLTGQTGSASTYPIKVHWFKGKPYIPWWHVFNRIIQLSYPQITHRIGQHKRISTMHPVYAYEGGRTAKERDSFWQFAHRYKTYLQCQLQYFSHIERVKWSSVTSHQSMSRHVLKRTVMLLKFYHNFFSGPQKEMFWRMFTLLHKIKVNGHHQVQQSETIWNWNNYSLKFSVMYIFKDELWQVLSVHLNFIVF